MSNVRLLIVLLSGLLGANAAFAAPAEQKFENLDRLDGLVAMTVGAPVGQPGGAVAPIDRRLRLASCPSLPSVEGPQMGAAIVRCEAIGWRIRVPLSGGGGHQVGTASFGIQGPAAPQRQIVIRKGDPVQLLAGTASFTVSKAMVAEENGAPGDLIRVRQDRNSPVIIARVEDMGVVRVPGI